MKKLWMLIIPALLIGVGVIWFMTRPSEDLFSREDIKDAQRLIGLDFTESEIDTLLSYLERNRKGYDSMRALPIGNEVFPALLFDVTPSGFQVDSTPQQGNAWELPAMLRLPEKGAALAHCNLQQLASLIRSGYVTSAELTRLYLDRITRYDTLQAVITVTADLAMEQAKRADEELAAGIDRGLLHGIPYGVKDLMAVPNYPTTWGSMPYRDQHLGYTASVVQRLSEAGAVLVAKLTSGALARGDVWFDGKTKNPWDLEQGASGSSAGSASATAAGLVAFSIGTETLGSIVSPSTRCGVTGLRPTYGRVSRYGTMSLSWSMDKIGPICRSAKDCAIVLDAIHGPDSLDQTLIQAPFNYRGEVDWGSLKVGYLEDQFENDSSDNNANNDSTLGVLRELGAELIPIQTPDGVPYDAFDIILRSEAGAFFDELVRSDGDDQMVQQDKRSRANSLRQSRFIPAVEYLQANRHRRVLIEKMDDVFDEVDVLVSPTFGGRQLVITNLTGHPAISVPNGFDEEGHPTSFTIVGRLFDEATILGLAESYQAATPFEEERPPMFAAD